MIWRGLQPGAADERAGDPTPLLVVQALRRWVLLLPALVGVAFQMGVGMAILFGLATYVLMLVVIHRRRRRLAALGLDLEHAIELASAELVVGLGERAALDLCRKATSARFQSRAIDDGPNVVRTSIPFGLGNPVEVRLAVQGLRTGGTRISLSSAMSSDAWVAVVELERWLRAHAPPSPTGGGTARPG